MPMGRDFAQVRCRHVLRLVPLIIAFGQRSTYVRMAIVLLEPKTMPGGLMRKKSAVAMVGDNWGLSVHIDFECKGCR